MPSGFLRTWSTLILLFQAAFALRPLNDQCLEATLVTDGFNGPYDIVDTTTSSLPDWTCGEVCSYF